MDSFSSHLIPPQFHAPDDLSFDDCELYAPSDADLSYYDRKSLRQQLSKFDRFVDPVNGSYFSPSFPDPGPTSVYGSGNNDPNPYIDASEPFSDKIANCFTETSTLKPPTPAHMRTGSNASGGYTHSDAFASPWTAQLSTPGLGSPSSSNLDHLGCYMSPQPAYPTDEHMIQPADECMYPSPADLAVSLPQVQGVPDQQSADEDVRMDMGMGIGMGIEMEMETEMENPVLLPSLLKESNGRRTSPAPVTPVDVDVDEASMIKHEPGRSPRRSSPTHRKSTTTDNRVQKPKSRPSTVHHSQRQSQSGSHQTRKGSGSSMLPSSSTSPKTTGRTRQFKCSFAEYGCDSVFAAKNEWKRHVSSQHLQLGFYRCDVDKCNIKHQHPNQHNRPHHKKNRSNHHHHRSSSSSSDDAASLTANDFNRKDLFTSHLRRMHAPWAAQERATDSRSPSARERETFEKSLDHIRERCWHQQREPPLHSQCGICGQEFQGEQSWDDRMEHVGRHYERDEAQPEQEMEDAFLRKWAIEQNIILPAEGGRWLLASLFK